MKYTINSEDIQKLDAKVLSLNKKFKQNGTELSYRKLNSYYKTDENHIIRHYVDVELEGYSKIGDYNVVALIEHGDKANIVHTINKEIKLPEEYRTSERKCDHCNINRFRKETVVLWDGKEFKQVGKSCLKEFLGIDVELYAYWLQVLNGMEVLQNDSRTSFSNRFLPVKDLIILAIHQTQTVGYIPRYTQAENRWGEVSSKFNENNTSDAILKMDYISTPELEKTYLSLLEWLYQVEDSEFIQNIKAIVTEGYITEKRVPMIACIYKVMLNDIARQQKLALKKLSEHVGKIGDKIEVVGTLRKLYESYSGYGVSYLYEIVSENNIYTWKTGSFFKEGEYTIKGTIKDHSEFRDIKQTVLTRCKAVENKEEPKILQVNEASRNIKEFFSMLEA